MTSASRVALALVLAAGLDKAARAQAPSPDPSTKCDIPDHIVQQLKAVHAKTAEGQKTICSAGPAGAPVPALRLSDGLGTPRLPMRKPALRENQPEYRLGPPTQPNDIPPRSLPRFSGR